MGGRSAGDRSRRGRDRVAARLEPDTASLSAPRLSQAIRITNTSARTNSVRRFRRMESGSRTRDG